MNKKVCLENIYWLNANKINNYFNHPLTKTRPFICVKKQKINNINYYYFISGTTKNSKDRRFKQFSKYFFEIKINKVFNDLSELTYFQSNIIYIIEEKSIELFFIKHSGKISEKDKRLTRKFINKSSEDEIIIFSIYSEKYNKWLILLHQSNFRDQASTNNKRKKETKKRINININNDKKFIKLIYSPYTKRIGNIK